jgi:hypothetical protein
MSKELLREQIERRLRREFEAGLKAEVSKRVRDAQWVARKESALIGRAFAKVDKVLSRLRAETQVAPVVEEEEPQRLRVVGED